MGHFVHNPFGMSFFLTTTVEYFGLLKSDMEKNALGGGVVVLTVTEGDDIQRQAAGAPQHASTAIER